MEPRIQYAQAKDGVSIAYYTMGKGHPLVVTSNVVWSHLRWQPSFREYHRSRSGQGLGRGLQVVRYDARGTGLSDRHSFDFSMEARLLDLEAVVERLKLTRFAIFGSAHGTPAAIAYAAGHPERVSHLILESGYASGRDWRGALADPLMRDEEWERFTLYQANWALDFSDGEAARRLASLFRESMTPESIRAFVEAMDAIDVTSLLPRVAPPTLVMYRPRSSDTSLREWSRELASKIPDAGYVEVTKRADPSWTDEETRIVEDFLGVNQEAPAPSRSDALLARSRKAAAAGPSSTAVILFADIADSTALTERLGDAAFREKARALDEALRSIIRVAGGTPVEGKLLGDGVLATFPSAKGAIEGALACARAGDRAGLGLHLGLHAGDVIREEGNVFGGAVTTASRISDLAPPGEVLVSQTVRDLARTSAGVSFDERGERDLKGVAVRQTQ
ncbi:MAG: adenylate/guanylate cyclase domain-containing protein [Dehalococcoidia bacterium]|nr:adenylate/guanylate cyclase domain-containing protein [Dehalococcoidia bacterium]